MVPASESNVSRSRTGRAWHVLAGAMMCLLLVACGGGGGTRADPPTPAPVAPPPTPPPPATTVVETPNPAYSAHWLWTRANIAQQQGLTGAGIRIGVIDTGVNRNHPALAGRVLANLNYVDPATNNLRVDDVVGHGTAVAQIIAGKPFGQWPGGIAPGAQILSARIINDKRPEDDGSGQGNEVSGALGLEPIHRELIARGMRIMNNSWGGLYWTNPNATNPIAEEYRDFIHNRDGLVVFSTGNSGFANPSSTAALPSQAGPGGSRPAADLERGWLAVAALDATNRQLLADYSNACGVAMHYCLAAPGTVVVTGTDDPSNRPDYWRWSGTSFSAPIVSGAAALVWEAFPYFNNDQVRQTLLGTAIDIGAPGVDPVFGYGALDVGSAVLGPARFDWGDFIADVGNGTSEWRNPISGAGGLVKRGSGTLVLREGGTFTGDTRVEGGTLRLEGNHQWSTDVTVAAGGRLGGYGRVDSIVNHGTVLSDDAPFGTRGDYRQSAGGRLAVLLGNEFLVNGTAWLDGDLQVLGWRNGYTTTSAVTILAAGSVVGQFATLSTASNIFLQGALDYRATHVILNITRMDVSSAAKSLPGISQSALSAAQRLEQAFVQLDRRDRTHGSAATAGDAVAVADDFVSIAGQFQQIDDAGKARAALDSLSGVSHSLATTLTFDGIDMSRRALSSRFSVARDRLDGVSVWKQSLGDGGLTGIASAGVMPQGWLMGRDQAWGRDAVAGFAFGESRVDDRIGDNRDRSRDRQAHAQLYAGRMDAQGYTMARLGFGRFDRSIERDLLAAVASDARSGVASRYTGDHLSLGVERGRVQHFGSLQLASYLGGEHIRVSSDGFTEWGGQGFGLQARAATMLRTQAIAGLRAEQVLPGGATLQAYGEWQQTLAADGFEVEASFIGIDSWSPLPLAAAARSGGMFGVGVEAWLTRDTRLSLRMDQRFGPHGDERRASLRYVWGF